MGKHLQSKYSDVSRKIIKSWRKRKSRTRLQSVNTKKVPNVSKIRREHWQLDDTNETLLKRHSLSEELIENIQNTRSFSTERNPNVPQNKRKYQGLDDTKEPVRKLRKISEDLIENDLNISLENEIIQNKVSVSASWNNTYLNEDDADHDTFFVDELRNNYFDLIVKDLYFHVIDEICLEGLDGITLEAFWKRLLVGLEGPLDINRNLKNYIWSIIRRNGNLKFYELPQPRRELLIHDRFSYVDSDIGVVTELAYELPDVYPYKLVSDPNITGSCSTFAERIDVSHIIKDMSLEQVETYGQKLVLVASQSLRTLALFSELVDPCIDVQGIEYCILERIGRSRKHGESTQGNLSLSFVLKMDPKSVFHYKKLLHSNNLISKQFLYMKSLVTDQNKSGRLLQLQRFHTTVKTKRLKIVEKIVDILKKQPEYRMDFNQIKNFLGSDILALGKVFKSQKFRKIVKTDAVYPYRYIYPDARRSEYMKRSGSGEKVVRCFELRNPFLNIAASWDNGNADSDEDDECEDENDPTAGKYHNIGTMPEVYCRISMSGEEGSSVVKVRRLMEVDRNTCRNSLRKLFHKRVITIQKLDQGKQRKMIYKASSLEEDGEDTKELLLPESPSGTPKKFRDKIIGIQALSVQKMEQEHSESKLNILGLYSIILEIDKLRIPNCQFLVQHFSARLKCNEGIKESESIFGFTRDLMKLTYKQCNINEFLNFKDILKISCLVSKPIIKSNFENVYSTKHDVEWITKLLLLKATFGEICINSESLCSDRQKRKYSEISIPKLYEPIGSSNYLDQKLQYMGDNPVIVFEETDRELNVVITVSTIPPAFNLETVYSKIKFQTERVAIRIQIILDQLNQRKVIEDIFRLSKLVTEEENKTGYKNKIDRKSLARLLKMMVAEGYIKIYKVNVTNSDITKTIVFICHPEIEYTNDLIQTSIQQLKWKYFVGCVKKSIKTNIPTVQKKLEETLKKKIQSPFAEIDVMSSINELKRIEKMKIIEMKCKTSRHTAKLYGVKPKFVRMRVLHEVLFYLIYEYKNAVEPLNAKEVKDLFQSCRIELSEKEFLVLPKIYTKEISWKMFIPPLPIHERWTDGWALLCDVILRLPVSVLCKVHACVYNSPGLVEILHHPIKRFYLVKDLPEEIRNVLLYKRKYLFSVHESISKLNYCGLLQYGPKKQKDKDQIFVYLNRRASLLNTTSSEPAYHKVEDKEYPQLPYYFTSQADLDDYWYNLNAISTNTKLNARNVGELVTMIDVSAKPELMKYTLSKTPEAAKRDDNGEIPGDRRGAAGVDSSLWSHLARNWFWSNRVPKDIPASVNTKSSEETALSRSKKVFLHKMPKSKVAMKLKHIPTKTSKKLLKYTRKIVERPKKLSRREYYDKLDRTILKKIGTSRRMRWSSKEDAVLMLCKVGDVFLCDNKYTKQMVPYHVIRDVLHRVSPESMNKTSRAVQRRMKKLLVYPHVQFDEKVRDLHKLQPISDYFSVLLNNISKGTDESGNPFRLSEEQVNVAYVVLMSCIFAHEKNATDVSQGNTINIDHLSDYNLAYTEKEAIEIDKPSYKFEDPKNEDDVKKNVLKSVIHSSITAKDQFKVALQLLKVYQKYPDHLIRNAVEELKLSNTITYKKKFALKKDNIWQTPFHLSQGYVFFQFTTFNITSAIEAYETFLALRHKSENGTPLNFTEETINTKRYGQLLGLNEFRSIWDKLKFEFDLPQNVIILNPRINDHSELTRELAMRYQLKLKKQKEIKENEQEVESDSQRSKFSSDLDRITIKEEILTSGSNGMDEDDIQNSPIDLTDDTPNTETINRLKTWVTDCIGADKERCPSPEFMDWDRQLLKEDAADETIPIEQTPVYSKPDDENDHLIEEVNMTEKKMAEQIPTLEEIEEEMLRLSSNEDRRIPYITDLSDLLNKDYSTDLPTDEKTLKKLKNHFITQYATLQKVVVEDSENFPGSILELVENKLKNKRIWNKIEKYIVIEKLLPFEEVFELLMKEGGTREDIDLMQNITEFVLSKDIYGASGKQIKERFAAFEKNISLTRIIWILIEAGIFLQTGICTIVFVHYKFQSFWLAETYQMTQEEQTVLLKIKEEKENEVFENQLSQRKMIMVKVMPWNQIDGSLNRETFRVWLCNVLSHCLDHPKIMFPKLCEKFCYLKPVDIYYCLQILQELGCLEVFVYEEVEITIFSKWELPKERSATILDDLMNCFIDVHNTAMICLGSFLYSHHE